MGLAVMMGVQTPAIAAETSQEATTQETVTQEATQELQTTEPENEEASVETAEEVETAEAQPEESLADKVETVETQTEEVETEEVQTEESQSEIQVVEIQTEEESEELQTQEPETSETLQTDAQEQESVTEASTEELIDQYALTEREEALTDGWHQDSDGNYTYVKDGEVLKDCVVKIGDSYYGFDWRGRRFTDTSFCITTDETVEGDYYRAKEDGSLYVNEWYEESRYSKYYYGEGGKAVSGLQVIEGKKYIFGSTGFLYTETAVSVDGSNYYCDSEGTVTELANNKWTLLEGSYFYVADGVILKRCVAQIGDAYYGFDSDGKMYENREFDIWTSEGSKYYRAKKGGSLYVNEWYKAENGDLYYYGEGGKAGNGFLELNGTNYYFTKGKAAQGECRSINGVVYVFGVDGASQIASDNSWIETGENYYYVKNGELLTGVAKFGDFYYGFDSDGKMYANAIFEIYNSQTGKNDYYYAYKDGSLCINEWVNSSYYGEDGKASIGLCEINDARYYFSTSGSLSKNTDVLVDGIYYYCASDGKVTELPNNTWVKVEGKYHYVKDGKVLKNCSAEIDGVKYSFDWNGILEEHSVKIEENERKNEWYNDGKYWKYYGADGKAYRNGLYEINDAQYYFSNEELQVSCVFSYNQRCYAADENGYLKEIVSDGWFQLGNDWYYIQNGKPVNGIVKIGDAYYGFNIDGKMYANEEFNRDNEYYRADANGHLYISQWYYGENTRGEVGWSYYDELGVRVSGKTEINGVTYLFDYDQLITNGVFSSWQMSGYAYYLADENGAWVQTPGWKQLNGAWYYVQEDGTLYTGILDDNGHKYYMQPIMATNADLRQIDGVLYSIDANGYMTIALDGVHEQSYADCYGIFETESLYYVSNGKFVQGQWQVINGKWYYFSKESDYAYTSDAHTYSALRNGAYRIDDEYYYFNADGTMATNGWIFAKNGNWYYALPSGVLATGDMNIGGTIYHFNVDGALQTGVTISGSTINLYNEGIMTISQNMLPGWNLIGQTYYYINAGKMLKDGSYRMPDGKWYAFDEKGKMQSNKQIENRWYDESGAAKTGWFQMAGNWYYADSESARLYKGFHQIGGKQYYFDKEGIMLIGEAVVDGDLVTADASGAITISALTDGWSSHNGEWYYYVKGRPYTGWIGDYYISNGKMARDSVVGYDSFSGYVDENGIRQKNTWCAGGLYYAKEDGTLVWGEAIKIDGKWYAFGWNDFSGPIITTEVAYWAHDVADGVYAEDGARILATNYPQGWSCIDGNWYYKNKYNFVYNQTMKINGDWYCFDIHGKMITGFSKPQTTIFAPGRTTEYTYDNAKFYYGADGKRIYYTGWQVIDGNWYYFNANSEAVDGWQMIGGVKYYFGKTDHFMYTGYKVIDGDLYYFDANGASQGISESVTGWHQQDGDWYYIRNGHVVTGTSVIDGTLYKFDDTGIWIS